VSGDALDTEQAPPRRGRLVLQLRPGDGMVVNGAALRFRTGAQVELSNQARFLFGKQILRPEEASTPARRVYFAIQAAYVCDDADRPHFLALAGERAREYGEATTSPVARDLLAGAIADLDAGRCWDAMRRVRGLFAHDDAVLGPQDATAEG
jgi:flagellar protein FlbT